MTRMLGAAPSLLTDSELFANYWNSYFNWRTGQLDDAAITDVVRTIWQHVNNNKVANEEVDRLKKLARMIEEEASSQCIPPTEVNKLLLRQLQL